MAMATTAASFDFVSWAGDAVFSGLFPDNIIITSMAASTSYCSSSPPSSRKCNEDSFINSENNIIHNKNILIDESSFESFSLGSDIISCQSVKDSDISETASEDDDDSDYVDSNNGEVKHDDDDCSDVDESLLDISDNEIESLIRDTNEVIQLERDAKEHQQNDTIGQHEHIHISSTSCSEKNSNEKLQEDIADEERYGCGNVNEQFDSSMKHVLNNQYNNNMIGNDDQQVPDTKSASDSHEGMTVETQSIVMHTTIPSFNDWAMNAIFSNLKEEIIYPPTRQTALLHFSDWARGTVFDGLPDNNSTINANLESTTEISVPSSEGKVLQRCKDIGNSIEVKAENRTVLNEEQQNDLNADKIETPDQCGSKPDDNKDDDKFEPETVATGVIDEFNTKSKPIVLNETLPFVVWARCAVYSNLKETIEPPQQKPSDDKSLQQDEEEEAPHAENKLEYDKKTSSPKITQALLPQHNQKEPIMIESGNITSKHSLNDNILEKQSCTTSSQVPSVDERDMDKMSQGVVEPFNQWATGVVYSGLTPKPPIMYHTVTPFRDWAIGVVFNGINIETDKKKDTTSLQSESNVMLDASGRSEKSVDFSEVVTTRVSVNKRESKTVCFRGHDSYIQNKQCRRSSTSIDVSVDMETLLMNEGEGTSTPKETGKHVNTVGIMNQCAGDLAFNFHECNSSSDVVDLPQDNSTITPQHPKMMAQHDTIKSETLNSHDKKSHQTKTNIISRKKGSRPSANDSINISAKDGTTMLTQSYTVPKITTVSVVKERQEDRVGLVFTDKRDKTILRKIMPDSPFQDTKLSIDDELLLINGHRIKNASKAAEFIKASQGRLTITVFNGSRPRESALEMMRLSDSDLKDIEFEVGTNQMVSINRAEGRFAKSGRIKVGHIVLSIDGIVVQHRERAMEILRESVLKGLAILLVFNVHKLRWKLIRKLPNPDLIWNNAFNECAIKLPSTSGKTNKRKRVLHILDDGRCEYVADLRKSIDSKTLREIDAFASNFTTGYQNAIGELRRTLLNQPRKY